MKNVKCSGLTAYIVRMSVFRNIESLRLDYVPDRLPHREEQLNQLIQLFKSSLFKVSLKIHVTGSTGTGKTVLCRRFGEAVPSEAEKYGQKVKYVHVNLAYTPKPYHIAQKILVGVAPRLAKPGLSPEEALSTVGEFLKSEGANLIICLDEVDTYIGEGGDSKILYMLSRFHELSPSASREWPHLSLIYVSRSLDWIGKLSEHVSDALGRVLRIHLEEYGLNQLRDILAYRAEEAFQPGAVSEEIIDFVADIARSYGGVRYGLELLMGAGQIAESDLAPEVKPDHVRRAHIQIPKGAIGCLNPSQLSLHKQLLLYGAANAIKGSKSPYVTLREIYEDYAYACEEWSVEAEPEKTIASYLRELAAEGYMIIRRRAGKTLYSTEFPTETLTKVMNELLKAWRNGKI